MADIRLAKPAAGTTQTVPSAPDGRFIFDFPADAATLTRNGDDLVLTFEDGAAIQLQGFYTTYSKEEMPSFQVDGVEISGQDFFAALGEDLMPAAGPAAGSSASRGGRYNAAGATCWTASIIWGVWTSVLAMAWSGPTIRSAAGRTRTSIPRSAASSLWTVTT